jgi:hypothetical protein
MSLKQQLASFGFESNDDYEYPLRLLFEAEPAGLRSLALTGESGRRKTAFAHALAQALEYPHVLYHDFAQPDAPAAQVVIDPESGQAQEVEAPVSAFERALIEACAYSEAARSILILDQLQQSEFAIQVRLAEFLRSREWTQAGGGVRANPQRLLVVLISEQPLYHSLQKQSFKIWTDAAQGFLDYQPQDFGLGSDAQPLFAALGECFRGLGQAPTPSEYRHILDDVLRRVRTIDQLRICFYGWMEDLDRARLYAGALTPSLEHAVQALNAYLGVEEIELCDSDPSHELDMRP